MPANPSLYKSIPDKKKWGHHPPEWQHSKICRLLTSRIGTNAVIARPKELFTKHRVSDVLWINSRFQYASAAFDDFASVWHFKHVPSSPHHPTLKRFAV